MGLITRDKTQRHDPGGLQGREYSERRQKRKPAKRP